MTATLDSPNDGSFGMPASSIVLEGSHVRFELNLVPASFTGSIDAAKSTMSRTWTQGGHDQPLVLSRRKT